VGLLGVELAPIARTNKLNGVSDSRWLVEALSKGVANEGSGSRVVAASHKCRSSRSFRPSSMVMQRCKIPIGLRRYSSLFSPYITYDLAHRGIQWASVRSSGSSPCVKQLRKGVRQSNGWLGCREGCSTSITSAAASRASTASTGSGAGASMLAPTLRLTDGSSRSLENVSSGIVP